ncbi:DUF1178 family protein [Geminicoccaceae bacterium 1502E]|nr:DUF1178 family protein [Geminicoccaceae bacterium 1502E]
MIRFTLACGNEHEFEGWFRDNAGYDEQVAKGVLSCPVCGDSSVRKAMMAPAISRGRREPAPAGSAPAAAPAAPATADPRRQVAEQMLRALRQLRTHVEQNFEHVGERFPEEARKIHHGEAEKREIYGEASREEVEELIDEGVQVRPLPWIPKLDG